MAVRLPVSFVVLSADAPPPVNRCTAKTEDVTPGGLSFLTSKKVSAGDRLDLALTLYIPTQTALPYKIRTRAHVVHVSSPASEVLCVSPSSTSEGPIETSASYLVGVALSGISEVEQMLLARFLFDVQQKRATK